MTSPTSNPGSSATEPPERIHIGVLGTPDTPEDRTHAYEQFRLNHRIDTVVADILRDTRARAATCHSTLEPGPSLLFADIADTLREMTRRTNPADDSVRLAVDLNTPTLPRPWSDDDVSYWDTTRCIADDEYINCALNRTEADRAMIDRLTHLIVVTGSPVTGTDGTPDETDDWGSAVDTGDLTADLSHRMTEAIEYAGDNDVTVIIIDRPVPGGDEH